MNEAVAAYLDAVSSGDRTAALEVVRRARDSGLTPLDVMSDVVGAAQLRIGELWAADRWSVAQEHAATAVSESVVAVLAAEIADPAPGGAAVVVSCVEQEWHALPALLVAEHLRADGLPVSYLGANASAEHLVRHVHETAPRAVALSCSLSASLPLVRRQVEAVRATGTPVVVGGSAFDGEGRRARAIGATAYARTGRDAVGVVRGLPTAVSPADPLTHEGAVEGQGVYADREDLTAALRARVAEAYPLGDGAELLPGWQQALTDHLSHLVGSVSAALLTGDRTVVVEGAVWLRSVMDHREAPSGVTERVLGELRRLLAEHPEATRVLAAV